MRLEGKKALITGAAQGIGKAIAFGMAKEGADIGIADVNIESAEKTAQEIRELGRKSISIKLDVSKQDSIATAFGIFMKEFGALDILVNNAGITKDTVLLRMKEEDWDAVLSVNLKGYFNYCHAVAGLFKEQGSGKIVTIASINGLRGKVGQANYAAAKAGGIALVKTLAKELGRYQVNVNVVAPGLVETDMTRALPKEALDKAVAETVLGRAATPEDIADAVVFLCSARARHITGEVLKVDGGQYI